MESYEEISWDSNRKRDWSVETTENYFWTCYSLLFLQLKNHSVVILAKVSNSVTIGVECGSWLCCEKRWWNCGQFVSCMAPCFPQRSQYVWKLKSMTATLWTQNPCPTGKCCTGVICCGADSRSPACCVWVCVDEHLCFGKHGPPTTLSCSPPSMKFLGWDIASWLSWHKTMSFAWQEKTWRKDRVRTSGEQNGLNYAWCFGGNRMTMKLVQPKNPKTKARIITILWSVGLGHAINVLVRFRGQEQISERQTMGPWRHWPLETSVPRLPCSPRGIVSCMTLAFDVCILWVSWRLKVFEDDVQGRCADKCAHGRKFLCHIVPTISRAILEVSWLSYIRPSLIQNILQLTTQASLARREKFACWVTRWHAHLFATSTNCVWTVHKHVFLGQTGVVVILWFFARKNATAH